MEPDLAVEGGLALFTSTWELGKTGVAAPEFSHMLWLPQLHICLAPEL